MSNSSYYSGGVAMVSVDDAVEIAELCLLAGKPDRIAEFLGGRLTPGLVRDQLAEAAAQPTPAANTTTKAAANSGSIFGGPTPTEKDGLTAAVRQRITAMYPRSQ